MTLCLGSDDLPPGGEPLLIPMATPGLPALHGSTAIASSGARFSPEREREGYKQPAPGSRLPRWKPEPSLVAMWLLKAV